jgi:polyhydroxyalkanoate synthase
MSHVSSDEIIQNIKKISDKYQEILFLLMQGKGAFIPTSLTDSETAKEMWSKGFKVFLDNPEKFVATNLEYTDKFRELVALSIDKFMGVETHDLYTPNNRDRRFKDPAWQENIYFDFVKQFYLMSSEWMKKSLSHYELEPQLKNYLEFQVKQFIDAFAPTNFILGNPEVFRETFESGWQNIVQGLDNFLDDIKESGDIFNIPTTDFQAFKVG